MKSKEETLECLKTCVLALKNQDDDITNDLNILLRWQDKAHKTIEDLKHLSEMDKEWFEKEWSEWLYNKFGQEIKEVSLKY